MARFNWFRGLQGYWNNPNNWQQGFVPGGNDDAYVPASANGGPVVGNPISVGSITNAGFVTFQDAGSSSVARDVINYHAFELVGSDLTIHGTLENINNRDLQAFVQILADGPGAPSHLDVGAIDSDSSLVISRSIVGVRSQASLGSGGTVTGLLALQGGALLAFQGTAQFTSIASNASLEILGNSYVADSGIDLKSNSALRGLRSIAGYLQLGNGAEIDTTGAVTNAYTGHVDLRLGGTLSAAGSFTNKGLISAVSYRQSVFSVGGVLNNTGEIDIGGAQGRQAANQLRIAGDVTNSGKFYFRSTSETFAQDVLGSGKMLLTNGTALDFKGTVSRGQQLILGQDSTFTLSDPTGFAANVRGFNGDDVLAIRGFDGNSTLSYRENGAGTAGVLTVSDGAAGSAHIRLTGQYDASDFHLTATGNGVRITT